MPPPNLSNFQKRALDYIRQEKLIETGSHLLIAVSGGPDSVALLHILHVLQQVLNLTRLTALHFDHRLRGKESEGDRAFVEKLAANLRVPLVCRSEDVLAYQRQHALSLEMAARELRHRFFYDLQVRLDAQRIALGHTANDQAEEILLRLFRGTGPSGMVGMLPKTDRGIIRPLLFATRQEIMAYLSEQGLSFRDDSSNQEPFCQRNVLRLEVFPILERHFHSQVISTLARHAGLVRDEEDYWERHLEECWASVCVEEAPLRIALRISSLLSLHHAVQKRILRLAISKIRGNLQGIYSIHLENLVQWVRQSSSGKIFEFPGALWAVHKGDSLLFSTIPPLFSQPAPLSLSAHIPRPGLYAFGPFHLNLSLQDRGSFPDQAMPPTSPHSVRLDADKVKWPLTLRTWQPGDRFQPMGLAGSKKLQDFFMDKKIPREQRKEIPLLCDREKICWIAGYRLDDRVKVTEQTQSVLAIEMRVNSET
ncbi:tRNA lysidine(34) synthetase TilS [Desulforhabdus amnigena]|uniref:tRNA(Ile)-lysidine synthase n=1 Tax=Desulforhabdus amnigena TaxID=40218 RepID=A0A9W6D5D5_9BACT|nr:tRNA lysidine(34) synthetase TilS [Desulforhabdus amnigena]NLJ26947.1 tRNA lysidine(34) synthetase TilS [Deltaproteobacteria bacterium]GLI34465.1 tRNA(Ile)-lysidine synthase [Desulforhabdus amnigena]